MSDLSSGIVRPVTNSAPADDPLTRPEPWNAVATGYDESFYGISQDLVEAALQRLELTPSVVLLDVATGPGTFAVRAAPRVARVTAIDFAENMIERLRARARAAGLRNLEARVMDGQALELAGASFDTVVSMFGWFLFADRARGLGEMHRVAKPRGRVLVTSWATPDRNTALGAGMEALRAAMPELPRPPGPLPTQTPEICAGELRAAGFDRVGTEAVVFPLPLGSVEEYWRMFEHGGAPIVLLKKRLGDAGWREVSDRALAQLRQRFGSGAIELRSEAIFTSGVRPG
jgi:SAM-dependent methyltransferase